MGLPLPLPTLAVPALAGLGLWWLLSNRKKKTTAISYRVVPNSQPSAGNLSASYSPSPSLLLPSGSKDGSNSADYLNHLQTAIADTATVHSDLTAQAQAGLVDPMVASQTMAQADANLRAPMDVLTMQKDLNVLGSQPALKEDGIKGSKTTKALKDFQTKMILDATGDLDGSTASALRRAVAAVLSSGANSGSSAATTGFWSNFASALGLSNDKLSALEVQTMLNKLGATPALKMDGIFGPLTRQAVKDFQTHNGLKSDGIVGPETASALEYFVAAVTPNLQQYVDLGGSGLSSPHAQPTPQAVTYAPDAAMQQYAAAGYYAGDMTAWGNYGQYNHFPSW